MKSSIKVEYDSVFTDNLGDKEPIIKVKIQDSDDPRDTLIRCIFTPTSKYDVKLKETTNEGDVYVIYSKNRYSQVCDLWEQVFNVMIHTIDAYDVIMCTSNSEIYFEKQSLHYRRSLGGNRDEMCNGMPDKEIIRKSVVDFTTFVSTFK